VQEGRAINTQETDPVKRLGKPKFSRVFSPFSFRQIFRIHPLSADYFYSYRRIANISGVDRIQSRPFTTLEVLQATTINEEGAGEEDKRSLVEVYEVRTCYCPLKQRVYRMHTLCFCNRFGTVHLAFATNTGVEHAVPSNDGGWIWHVGRKARKEAKT
jgi:hypothetical protein